MLKTLLISGMCAAAAFAQTTITKIADEHSGPIGITAALAGPASTIPGAPYSAKAVTQRVQLLADGNRITQTTTNAVARDSMGRVYREESLPGFLKNDPQGPRLVIIRDPVAGLHITLNSATKTATKVQAADQKKMDEQAFTLQMFTVEDKPGGDENHTQIVLRNSAVVQEDGTKTDLGMQTIEGVTAKGTRITHTIEAGAMGNDLPIVITTETWFSPDLKLLVMSKSNDPRMGETTYKLTNLSRAEPDPTLFKIPADYTVSDQPNNKVFFRTKLDK